MLTNESPHIVELGESSDRAEKECLRRAGVPLSFATNIIRERNKRVRGLISACETASVQVCMEGLATEAAA